MFLLEALVALLVLALGTAGLLGILVGALRESADAGARAEADALAASTLGRMWAEPPDDLVARYDAAANGAGYQALVAAASRLPGVTASVNAPIVSIVDGADTTRTVVVTVFWQKPGDERAHVASAAGVLSSR